MEQLLLVTSCDSPAGIGASLRTDGRTDERTDGRTNGWTHRRDVGNSILDIINISITKLSLICTMIDITINIIRNILSL